jgi:hypothetical protein
MTSWHRIATKFPGNKKMQIEEIFTVGAVKTPSLKRKIRRAAAPRHE